MRVGVPVIGSVRALLVPVMPVLMGVMVALATQAEPYESLFPHNDRPWASRPHS
jgi:hypothetical protein